MAGLYDDLFNNAAANTGLDADLLSAVSMAESSYDPNAVSNAGANGLMQLMPNTAAQPGIGTGVTPFDQNKPLTDPQENVRFGSEYLAYLIKRYNGDEELALMAYNGGMGTVDKWLKDGADPSKLNDETRNYPIRVKAALDKIRAGAPDIDMPDAVDAALEVSGGAEQVEPQANPKPGMFERAREKNKSNLKIDRTKPSWLEARGKVAGAAALNTIGGLGKMIDDVDNFIGDWIPMQDELDGMFRKAAELNTSAASADRSNNAALQWTSDAIDSTMQMVPAFALALAKKNPYALGVIGTQVAATTYAEAREEGMSPMDAAFKAGRMTLYEVGAEKYVKFLKNVPVASGLKGWLLQGAREGASEAVTSVLTQADEVLIQDKEFGGVAAALKRTAYEGSLGTGVGLALGAGALARKKPGTEPDVPRGTQLELDLGLDTPIDELPPLPEQGTLGLGGAMARPSRPDPTQLELELPTPPNAAIAGGVSDMEASLDADKILPDANAALEAPNEEQTKGMFAQAEQIILERQAEQDKARLEPIVPEGNIQEEEINRNDLTVVGPETLGSLPNVSSQDAAAIDARLQESIPDPEIRQIAVEGLLEELNDARVAMPEASVEAVLRNVAAPTRTEPAPVAAPAKDETIEIDGEPRVARSMQRTADMTKSRDSIEATLAGLKAGTITQAQAQVELDNSREYHMQNGQGTEAQTAAAYELSGLLGEEGGASTPQQAELKARALHKGQAMGEPEAPPLQDVPFRDDYTPVPKGEAFKDLDEMAEYYYYDYTGKSEAPTVEQKQAAKKILQSLGATPDMDLPHVRRMLEYSQTGVDPATEVDTSPTEEQSNAEDARKILMRMEPEAATRARAEYTDEQLGDMVEEVYSEIESRLPEGQLLDNDDPRIHKAVAKRLAKADRNRVVEPTPEPQADVGMTNEEILADPEQAYYDLMESGLSEEEAGAAIDAAEAEAGLVPANEAEAEYDASKQKPGRMRPVTQPSEGQQQLRVTRTQPAVNEFEDRLKAHTDKKGQPGALPEDQIGGVEVLPGDVLDLWHGTTADFDLHQAKTNGLSPGLWFSNNEGTAEHYASEEWAGQQDVGGPKRPRKLVVRAVPKNPLTLAWTPEYNDMYQYHQAVQLAKEAGYDMVVFTGIDTAFAGTKPGKRGRADSEKPTQGVEGLDNYYVVLDKNILTHRPGRDTLKLTPEEAAKMEADQTAEERKGLDVESRKDFDAAQAAKALAAELEANGPVPTQGQLFTQKGKATAGAKRAVRTPAQGKKQSVLDTGGAKVEDTSVRSDAAQQSTHTKFKLSQRVKLSKTQTKILADLLPEGSTFAASMTPEGLAFNTVEQAKAFYEMMKKNFNSKDGTMKSQLHPATMKTMMRVAYKVNKTKKAETIPNPNAPVVAKPAKKVAKKKARRKKASRKKTPAPETVQAPPESDPESLLDETPAEPEPEEGTATRDTTDKRATRKSEPKGGRTRAAKRRGKNQRPAKADEVKDEEKAAVEGSDSLLRGKPPAGQTVSDDSPTNMDQDSQEKAAVVDDNLSERDPDEATEPGDVPGNRADSQAATNEALQDMIYMHSGKWADLFYYWVANTEFMGLNKKAAKYHQGQRETGTSTARGDVAARRQYIADMKAWKTRKAQARKEQQRLINQVEGGIIPPPAGYNPDAFEFTEPKPQPPSKRRKPGDAGEYNYDEFKELYQRAMGRTKLWWMERMTDQHYAVKLVNNVLADENGYVKDSVQLYEALTRIGSAVDIKIKKFHGNQQAAIEKAAEAAGMAFEDVNQFSGALHSLMRNGYIHRRNVQKGQLAEAYDPNPANETVGYSGMSNKEAYDVLAEMEATFGRENLAAVEQAVFDTAKFLRSTMVGGQLAADEQIASWGTDEGGYIHNTYMELRDSQGYAAALDPSNYDLTQIDAKEVDNYDFSSINEAKEATLLDTLHNITYVPLSDIDTSTVSEVIRQQIQAKAGANFYSEYDVYGDDVDTAYGRQDRGAASAAVTHLLSHSQQALIRADHNVEHAGRIRSMVEKLNDPYFGIALPEAKEGYYNVPGNIKKAVVREFHQRGLVPPKLSAGIDMLTFRMKNGGNSLPTVIFDLTTANALTNSYTSTNTKRVFNAIGNSSSWVRKAMTAWSPPFIGTNFVREVWNAKVQTRGIKGLTEAQLKEVQKKATFGESFRWMKTIFNQIQDPNLDVTAITDPGERAMAEQFKALHEAGMTSEFFHIKDLDQMQRELEKVERALNRPTKAGMKKTREMFKMLGENLELAAAVSENAVRMAVAAEVMNQTGDVNFAASVGKDLSVNFQRYGTWGSAINSLFFFYNPTVQGLYRAKRALHHKEVRNIVAGAAVFGAMMPLLNRMLAGDDEEGNNYYEQVPHWKRSTNFIMMIPGGEGRHITIPLPYVWNLPYALSEKLVDGMTSNSQEAVGEKVGRIAGEMFGLGMENVSPISYSSNDPTRTVVPTMAQPFYDVMNNQNWFGSYINPGKNQYAAAPVSDAYNIKDPDSKKKWQAVSQAMAIGGSKYKAGLVDVSPGTLEYLFGYYTGGAGTFFTRTLDTVAAVFTGGGGKSFEENVAEAPILRRIYGLGKPDVGVRDRYYQLRTDMSAVANAKKDLTTARDSEGIQVLMANEGDLYKSGTMRRFESSEKRIRKWVTARNRIVKRSDKTETQLKQVEKYNSLITAEMTRFNKYYFDRIVSENMQ